MWAVDYVAPHHLRRGQSLGPRIGGRYRHGRRQRNRDGGIERSERSPLIRFTIAAPWSTHRSALGLTGFRCGFRCALGCRNPLRTLLFDAHGLFDRARAPCDCVAQTASGEPHTGENREHKETRPDRPRTR